jgi:hypothetical protein
MTILPSIATSLRKKYNKWLFMSRRPNQNRPQYPIPRPTKVVGSGARLSRQIAGRNVSYALA